MYDVSIPGYCPVAQLSALAALAEAIPENGLIVEVGTHYGRSAYALAASARPSVKIYCVDIWEFSPVYEAFRLLTAPRCPNILPIQSASPLADWPNGKVNLVYIDGAHDYSSVTADIKFWGKQLAEGGLLCGDDYIPDDFPGVVQAVDEYAKERGLYPFTIGKFWCLVSEENHALASMALKGSLAATQRLKRRGPSPVARKMCTLAPSVDNLQSEFF